MLIYNKKFSEMTYPAILLLLQMYSLLRERIYQAEDSYTVLTFIWMN